MTIPDFFGTKMFHIYRRVAPDGNGIVLDSNIYYDSIQQSFLFHFHDSQLHESDSNHEDNRLANTSVIKQYVSKRISVEIVFWIILDPHNMTFLLLLEHKDDLLGSTAPIAVIFYMRLMSWGHGMGFGGKCIPWVNSLVPVSQ